MTCGASPANEALEHAFDGKIGAKAASAETPTAF